MEQYPAVPKLFKGMYYNTAYRKCKDRITLHNQNELKSMNKECKTTFQHSRLRLRSVFIKTDWVCYVWCNI